MAASTRYRAAALATALALCAHGAQAAWVVQPTFELSTGYDDNVRLSESEEQDAIVTQGTAQATVRNVTETSEVAAVGGIGYLVYSNMEGENQLDDQDLQYLRVTASRRTERAQFGVRTSGRRDLVLRRNDPLFDPIDARDLDPDSAQLDTDTGEVDVSSVREQVRRMRFDVAPYAQFDLTDRTSTRFGLSYAQRHFDSDGEALGLRDSTTSGADAQLIRAMSPRTSMNATIGYALLETDTAVDTDTYRATLGWEHQLSPTTQIGADVGANRTENDFASDTSLTYQVRFARATPVSRISLHAERSAIASPFGGAEQADRLGARYRRSLAERVELGMSLYGYRSQRIGIGGDTDRDYVDARPEIVWRLSRSWSLGAAYTYRWIDRKGEEDETAQSNAVSVSLRYQPPRQI
jgi:opacity protein-like surface antigen